jgi:hypothetical protein
MCAENNRRPKFYKLLVNNGDGSYSLQPDGSTDGYWKLLIDFKMYNHLTGEGAEQKPVRPIFDMDACQRMLNNYKGGHQSFPVAQDIVDSFVNEYKGRGKAKYSNGKYTLEGGKFSITPAENAEYMKAAEAGDEETAGEMVADAASRAGYTRRIYHGTGNGNDIHVFKFGRAGIYTTDDKDIARTYGSSVYDLYGKEGTKVLNVDAGEYGHFGIPADRIPLDFSEYPLLRGKDRYSTDDISRIAFVEGYDVVIIKNVYDDESAFSPNATHKTGTDIVYKDPNQIKSADPITYDDNGNIIPLNERFNPKNDDIRYSYTENDSQPEQDTKLRPMTADDKADRVMRNAEYSSKVMTRKAAADARETKAQAADKAKETVANAREVGKAYEELGKEKADRRIRNAQVTSKMLERESKRKAEEQAKQIVDDARAQAKATELNAKEAGKAYEALGRERAKAAEQRGFEQGQERSNKQFVKMVRDFEAKQRKTADRKNDHIARWNEVHNQVYKPIETTADAMEMYKALKIARANRKRTASSAGLTDKEKTYVGRLLRGEETAERLFEVPDIRYLKVLTVATSAYNESQLGRILSDYRSHLRAVKNAVAAQAVGPVFNKLRDITMGILGDLQTPERVMEYIADNDYDTADLLKQLYVKPMVQADADEVRLKDTVRDMVRKMHLDNKVRKGNKVSEDYAVQYLGELMSNAEALREETDSWNKTHEARLNRLQGDGNTLLTGEQQEKLRKEQDRKPPQRDGMTLEETEKAIADFKAENSALDYNRIENELIPQFRQIYNALFEMMNNVRVANGYEPVDYRKGYFPHYRRDDVSALTRFARSLGMDFDTKLLPTTIQGLTQDFRPGINWFGNALERKGHETDYGVTEGIDRYIEGVSKVIYRTNAIQNMRALANTIRRLSDSRWQKRIDQIYSDRVLSDDEKYEKIEDEYRKAIHDEDPKKQRTNLANFVTWLDENANTYAGKATYLDRGVRNMMQNRATKGLAKLLTPLTNLPRAIVTNYGGNTVSVNPGSWLTNFAPIFEAAAETNPYYAAKALLTMRDQLLRGDEFRDASNFITARFGSDTLVQPDGAFRRAVNTMAKPMEWIDGFTSYVVTHMRYASNIGRGMSSAAALEEADEFAARLMADRADGRLPIAMQHKNPFVKILTQFQTEALNSFEHNTHDVMYQLGKRYKDEKPARKALAVLLHYMAFAGRKALLLWLCNELYEALVGRRFMPDPIDWANEFRGDLTGEQTPNLINTGIEQGLYNVTGGKLGHDTADDWYVKKDEKNALKNLGKNVAEELPIVGGLLGGGRFPVQTAFKDVSKLPKGIDQLFDEDDKNTQEAIANIVKGMSGPLTYLILPGAGTEIKRIVQAAEQYAQGGAYDEKGQLKYPLYTDNPLETAANVGKIALFGATSTDAGQKWVDSGFNSFSKAATAAYQALTALDIPTREAYSIVNKFRDVEKTEDETEAYERRQYIRGLDISGQAKAALYETLCLQQGSKARDVIDTLDIMGADMNKAMDLMFDIADINRKNYIAEESKSKDIRDAICSSKLSGDDKLYVYENYGLTGNSERERAMLDKISQTEDGGDIVDLMNAIKSAAKTDEESESALKRKAINDSNLSGDGKLSVYKDYVLTSSSQKEIDCLNELEGKCDSGELVRTAMALKESGKTVDDLKVLLDSKLPTAVKETIYGTLVAGNKDEKIEAFKKAGMSFDDYLKAAYKYSEINAKDLKPVQKATEFARWADTTLGSGSGAAKENMKYSSGFSVEASGYEKMTGTGLSAERAYDLTQKLDELEPLTGAKSVSHAQKWDVIINSGLNTAEQLDVIKAVSYDGEYYDFKISNDYGVDPKGYKAFLDSMPSYDADGNGSYKQAEVKAALDAASGLTNKQKAAIWQLHGSSTTAKNNPYSTEVGNYVLQLLKEMKAQTEKEKASASSASEALNPPKASASSSAPAKNNSSAADALRAALAPPRG